MTVLRVLTIAVLAAVSMGGSWAQTTPASNTSCVAYSQPAADIWMGVPRLVSNMRPCVRPADYFPLEVGNTWIYRGSGTYIATALTLEVTQSKTYNGKLYFQLTGLPDADYWLRFNEKGLLVAYDPSRDTESLWWNFLSPPGQSYTTELPGTCCHLASVVSRNAAYKGPIGSFQNGLEMGYPGVFQIGLEKDVFLPGIGLTYRSKATGGPSYGAYELIYARVGGATAATAPELSFGLSLDNSGYTVNMMPPVPPDIAPVMYARITLRNTGQPLTLNFPSGQAYDFVIRNEKGDVVYRWSDGKAFTMALRSITVGPGELNFTIPVRLAGADGKPLPAGKYTAEGWLTTMGSKIYDATAGFEIRWVY